ncbi:MAG TPA: mechanosensitive ion channel domain-containing protein [Kribbellaceae bacterium]|jgi:small conductance mechanosensitive channel
MDMQLIAHALPWDDITKAQKIAWESVKVPARIAVVVIGFFVLRWLSHKLIDRLARRTAGGTVPGVLARSRRATRFVEENLLSERRQQRAETMASLLKSTATIVLSAMAGVMVLDELGFDILPILASASLVGVALGFGAQTLVKDFLAGIFMILEDQYGVGDYIDMEKASGTVESVGLRVTRLRDNDGTIWYVRNGEITRVGNHSQHNGEPPGEPAQTAG